MVGLFAVAAAYVAANPVVVVSTQANVGPAEFQAARAKLQAEGFVAISTADALARLLGRDAWQAPNLDALKAMVADAREREARFDSPGANAVREQVLDAFAKAAPKSAELVEVAKQAALDWVSSLMNERDNAQVATAADRALSMFGPVVADPSQYPPALQVVLDDAAKRLRTRPVENRTVGSVKAWVDGREVGTGTQAIALGEHEVWFGHAEGNSVPRPLATDVIALGDSPLDSVVLVRDELLLVCQDCSTDLQHLSERLTIPVQTLTSQGLGGRYPQETGQRFSATHLLPLGIGQGFQSRWGVAAAVASAQVIFAGWNILAYKRHQGALERSDTDAEVSWRRQQNISAVGLYTALAVGLADAILFDALN